MNKLKFLFTGGGTGGHVYPNIAIHESLKEKYPDAEFLYVGSKKGSEASIVPAMEQPMPFLSVPTRGLPQNIRSLRTLASLLAILAGAIKSFFILRRFRADVVIGSGGYVSAPVLLAAAFRKQKIFIHEQNAVPGRLNLFSARFADKIGVAFPSSTFFFPADKVICTGYPLRRSILSPNEKNVRAKFAIPEKSRVLFIFSGSMGARTINQAAAAVIPRLLTLPDLFIVLSTGKAYGRDYKALDETVKILERNGCPTEIPGRLLVREYFDPIAEIYAIADLVVSRAGAGAIKEITTMGLPSILIPKLNLPADHQIVNAREVEKTGGARILYEEVSGQGKDLRIEIPTDAFFQAVQELLDGGEPLARMRRNLELQEKQDSAARIVEAIDSLIGKKEKAEKKALRRFYLQSLEDERNLELPFSATWVGNSARADIRLENMTGRSLFEIRFVDPGNGRAIIRRRKGRLRLNDRDLADWAPLNEDDRIGINGHHFVFKSHMETVPDDGDPASAPSDPLPDGSRPLFASCLGNLGRAIVQAAVFGAGRAMDTFSIAWALASFLRHSVGEGAMQKVFRPIFRRLFRGAPRKKAWEAASTMTNVTLVLSLLVSAAGVLLAPLAVRLLFPALAARGSAGDASFMMRILFPCLLLSSLVAILSAYLREFGRLAVVTASVIVFSLGSILAVLLLLPLAGMFALGYAMLLGGALQAAFLLPFLFKILRRPEVEFSWRPLIRLKGVPGRKYAFQLPSLVRDDFLARSAGVAERILASSLASGSLSYLYFAIEIFRLPFAAISRAIARVVLKDFSAQSALFDNEKSKRLFMDGLRITLFLLAPLSILIIFLAEPLVSLLLQRFHFGPRAAAHTALALQFYAVGLVGWGVHALTARIFSLRLEQRLLGRLNFFMLLFNILLIVLLIRTPLTFAGVALAASLSQLLFAVIRVFVLRRRLNREGEPLPSSEIVRALAKTLSACLLMVIAITEAKFIFNRIRFDSPIVENLILCVSLSFMGTAIYFLASLLFKNSGVLFFKKPAVENRRPVPLALLPPSRFLEQAALNPDFLKNEFRYKINVYLSSPAWSVRNIGVKLIGLFKEKSKGPYLADLLAARSGNGFMRRNALQALKAINYWNPEFKTLLLRLLHDSYFEVRVAALDILGDNLSEAEYADLRKTIQRTLRRGRFEEKAACLRLIARKGNGADLPPLRRLYLDSNSLLREELLELLYVFFRRGLLSGAEIRKHIEQVLITSDHLAAEFRVKSIIKRIYREIEQP
jgi:undecaprenyldiphospho-muramoylpentapeptide beta-N-acetylglucosaminyltransferase/murein biosynthesis integral membrane protein MurJ